MITLPLHLFRLFPLLCGGHRQFALEHVTLRQQLAVDKRKAARAQLQRATVMRTGEVLTAPHSPWQKLPPVARTLARSSRSPPQDRGEAVRRGDAQRQAAARAVARCRSASQTTKQSRWKCRLGRSRNSASISKW